MAGKPGRDEEPRQGVDRRDDRDRVRHHIDHAAPAFRDRDIAECRKAFGDAGAGPLQHERIRLRVKHPHRLERRLSVKRPFARRLPFLDKAPADPKPQFLPMQADARQVFRKQAEAVRHEIDRAHPQGRDRVAAIHPLAVAEQPARGRDFRSALERFGAHDRRQYPQLRQFDPEIAAKQP